MRTTSALLAGALVGVSFASVVAVGCGNDFADTSDKEAGVDPNLDASSFIDASSSIDATGPIFMGPDGSGDGSVCDNLECRQTTCPNGGKTTLSGTVYDPAGKVPLYNVIVYVPNAPLKPIVAGATCDQCSGTVSGKPLISALTDAKGHFVLENVPVGANVPLVIQIGKWRREVVVPNVQACADTPMTDSSVTRLPKNHGEGDIPRIAITTGGADPLECLLRKIGLEDSEFGPAGSAARVHLYAGSGYTPQGQPEAKAASKFAASLNAGAAFGDATALWSDVAKLKAYDLVLLACEGQQNAATKPQTALDALYAFESQGGRVFASHWHDYWFASGPAPLPSTGSWTDLTAPPPNPVDGTIDTSFPKGAALKEWLGNVKGLTDAGQITIKEAKHNVSSVDAGVQQWITLQNPNTDPAGQTAVQYLTFNTPVGVPAANQCGRVVYSDLHVSSGDQVGKPFPSGCLTQDLSPQEKALEFMLFDLSSCIQKDEDKPQPPK